MALTRIGSPGSAYGPTLPNGSPTIREPSRGAPTNENPVAACPVAFADGPRRLGRPVSGSESPSNIPAVPPQLRRAPEDLFQPETWGRRALGDTRGVQLVDIATVQERCDDRRHAAEVADDMLLGGHYEDAAVGLLDGHLDQIRWRILRITVPHQPQHRGIGADRRRVVGRHDALREVLAHGGALPGPGPALAAARSFQRRVGPPR